MSQFDEAFPLCHMHVGVSVNGNRLKTTILININNAPSKFAPVEMLFAV